MPEGLGELPKDSGDECALSWAQRNCYRGGRPARRTAVGTALLFAYVAGRYVPASRLGVGCGTPAMWRQRRAEASATPALAASRCRWIAR